ncbi:MAG: hypothetical protein JWN62_444 [Acidimicrobiales bacterium]|nr:hypothetical protein [Acidimicrobiales bacterium]
MRKASAAAALTGGRWSGQCLEMTTPPIGSGQPDDEFHVPTSDDGEWSETCWFTFAIPERRMSVQFYPYFRANMGVAAGAVYVWDGMDGQLSTSRYAKNFWHLPMPTSPLSDMHLANGITYRAVEPTSRYTVGFDDPDGGDLHIELDVRCIDQPFRLHTHYDQATRATGTIVLDGETIAVDCVGFRDRSWGVRSQFGSAVMGPATYAPYSWGTAADDDGFFSMCGDFGNGAINVHGFLRRDGVQAKIVSGTHQALERSDLTGYPLHVVIVGTDELGRTFTADGRAINGFGWNINPNLYTINSLMHWSIDGVDAFGEQHDNWSAASIREFHRARRRD